MTRHLTAIALTCVSLSLGASRADAQPRPAQPVAADEAEHARGIELRRQHRDAEARDVFRAIYERTHEPRALARQASAEAAVGDWVVAEEHLSVALEQSTDPWITQNRAGLTADLEGFRQRVGLLEVSSNTPHAEVWLGGVRVATLPLDRALHVRAGALTFEVRAEGYTPQVRTTTVQPGGRLPTRELVDLTPVPPAPTPVPPAPVVAAGVAAPPPVVVAPPPPPRDEPAPSWFTPLHIAGLSLAGAGVIGVGVGIAGLVIKSNHESTLDQEPCLSDSQLAMSQCLDAFDGSESANTLSIVGFATGGALLAGGIVMMIIPGGAPSRGSRVSLTTGPGDVGLGLHGTF